uniref:Uncharacterized protein n=1 Tax=Steinernema glaseri TaxID=37863 RepID=A0A1I8AFK3_9BILA
MPVTVGRCNFLGTQHRRNEGSIWPECSKTFQKLGFAGEFIEKGHHAFQSLHSFTTPSVGHLKNALKSCQFLNRASSTGATSGMQSVLFVVPLRVSIYNQRVQLNCYLTAAQGQNTPLIPGHRNINAKKNLVYQCLGFVGVN